MGVIFFLRRIGSVSGPIRARYKKLIFFLKDRGPHFLVVYRVCICIVSELHIDRWYFLFVSCPYLAQIGVVSDPYRVHMRLYRIQIEPYRTQIGLYRVRILPYWVRYKTNIKELKQNFSLHT